MQIFAHNFTTKLKKTKPEKQIKSDGVFYVMYAFSSFAVSLRHKSCNTRTQLRNKKRLLICSLSSKVTCPWAAVLRCRCVCDSVSGGTAGVRQAGARLEDALYHKAGRYPEICLMALFRSRYVSCLRGFAAWNGLSPWPGWTGACTRPSPSALSSSSPHLPP